MPKRPKRAGPGAPQLQANVAELRALAHPLRLRILELFAEAPRTTKQVADLLGQPPTRLYHHVAALERAGLLALRETRKNRGTTEKWYETPAKQLGAVVARGRKKPGEAQARRGAALTILEQSKHEMLAAMAAEGIAPLLARLIVAAPPDVVAKIRERLLGLVAELQSSYDCDPAAAPADSVDRWAMTMTFAPVVTLERLNA